MTTASEQLLGCADDPHFYKAREKLQPLWLAAANERLAEQRERIPVLARLADDLGIKQFESLSDLIRLLFAHFNYKSNAEAFIDNGRWNLMNQWMYTLSSNRVKGIDVDDVTAGPAPPPRVPQPDPPPSPEASQPVVPPATEAAPPPPPDTPAGQPLVSSTLSPSGFDGNPAVAFARCGPGSGKYMAPDGCTTGAEPTGAAGPSSLLTAHDRDQVEARPDPHGASDSAPNGSSSIRADKEDQWCGDKVDPLRHG